MKTFGGALDASLKAASRELGSKVRTGEEKLKPCESRAIQSYDDAIRSASDLNGNSLALIYEWIKDNRVCAYDDCELPEFETWNTYRRAACRKLGRPPRNKPRVGRIVGKSVVHRNDV